MADIAALSFAVDTTALKAATLALKDLPPAASAAQRAAEKWGAANDAAGRSADDFSKRVKRTIADLEFQRQQLARTSTEQARFAALRRAGVAEASAEGQAISFSVKALQAQEAALGKVSIATKAFGAAWHSIKEILAALTLAKIIDKLVGMSKSAFETAAHLDELAQQVGTTAKNLQALQFHASQSGVSLEQLDTGLSKFSQKMGEAADGSKPVIDALKKLGVNNLDLQGNLRPTEDLMTDVAKAILAIDEPARQSAASVEFFGKSGTRMLPLLREIAKGADAMADSTQRAGAMISDDTIATLNKLDQRMAARKQKTQAFFAENLAMVYGWSKEIIAWDDDVTAKIGKFASELTKTIVTARNDLIDGMEVEGARGAAMFLEAFLALPEQFGKLFVDAWNAAKRASAEGLNSLTAWLAEKAPAWMGITGTNAPATITPGGGASLGAIGQRMTAAGQAAADQVLVAQQAARDAAAQKALVDRQAGMQGDEAAARGGRVAENLLGGTNTAGSRLSAVKDTSTAAEDAEKKYAKLVLQLEATAKAQDLMTAASARGDVAFEAAKAHLDAQQKTLEIYGKVLDDTDPKLLKIEATLLRISQGKAAEAFNVATTELQKENVLLEAQIALMNQAPDIQAREIALIKAKQEAEKAGTAVTQEMIDARKQAIEQNETLKLQQEELKKAQELWTAPLTSALQSIQSTAADAFAGMLESGNFTFQSLAESFKKIMIRMAAEFLALATIRPVMSVLVNAISPSMAQQMGMGTNTSGAAGSTGGGLFGGGGLGGMFGGGGGISDFFGKTLFGGSEIMGPLQPGAAALGSTGGLTVGGALGGAAGIGSGLFQMLSGKGSTGSMLGGAASILGGGLALIGPMLGLGAAAGPIGMGIGLLGALLPSLLGGGTPEPPKNYSTAQMNWQNGRYVTAGASYGNPDPSGQLTGGSAMEALYRLAGGIKDPSRVYGTGVSTFSQGDFSNASSFIIGPNGEKKPWGMGSNEGEVGLAAANANAALNTLLDGAVKLSDNMRKAVSSIGDAQSIDHLTQVVTEVNAFDDAIKNLGKTTTSMASALKGIDDQFQSLIDIGNKYGFDNSGIQAEKQKARQGVLDDFTKTLQYGVLDIKDPGKAALMRLDDEKKSLIEQNDTIIESFGKTASRIADIEAYYATKRAKIIEDTNKQAQSSLVSALSSNVNTIQDLIRQLSPGGGLSNLDPTSQLAGLRASSQASWAQAISDPTNSTLVQNAVGAASAFLQFDKSYTGGGSAYTRDREIALSQLQSLQAGGVQTGIAQSTDPAAVALLQQLLAAVKTSNDNSATRNADIDRVFGLLSRYLTNGTAAA